MLAVKAMCFCTIGLSVFLSGQTSAAFLGGDKIFSNISNYHREADAWATCSALYALSSTIDPGTALSEHYANMSRGAEVAVLMVHIKSGFDEDITPEGFQSLLSSSQVIMKELPKTKATYIKLQLESSDNLEGLFASIVDDLEVCLKNSASQQEYIDQYRDLSKSILKSFWE